MTPTLNLLNQAGSFSATYPKSVEIKEKKMDTLRGIPYGDYPTDCDFTIGEAKTTDGGSIFGVIWYSGGESWRWSDYESALASARRMSALLHLAPPVFV